MIIKNAMVYTPEHMFAKQNVYIEKERIVSAPIELAQEVVDGEGLYAIPGLVDIHFHGAMGYDFCNSLLEELEEIAEYEAKNGILAMCPATMSLPEEKLLRVMDVAYNFAQCDVKEGADLVGIHMEGPFISPEKAGAQNREHLCDPDFDLYCRLQDMSGGLIKIVDVAPELLGAMNFIEACKDEVKVSISHTNCDYKTAVEALAHGASHVTHLFNAMPGIHHRKPGPIIAAAECGAEAEIIADGIHVKPVMVRFAFYTYGRDKVCLISDSMEATGLPDGEYQLGGQSVVVSGKKATLKSETKTIAGSVTNLFDCMKIAVTQMGISFEDAIQAAAENPAKAIGIDDFYGSLKEGCFGNVVLVDQNFVIHKVIKKGHVIYQKNEDN